jgi:hypothetical protein
MNHTKINAKNWLSEKHIWSPYLTLDVISLSLIWIEFTKKMRIVAENIDVKKYMTIAQLAYSVVTKDQKLPYFIDPKVREFV